MKTKKNRPSPKDFPYQCLCCNEHLKDSQVYFSQQRARGLPWQDAVHTNAKNRQCGPVGPRPC